MFKKLYPTLCFWYAKVGDYDCVRQVVYTMEAGKFDLDVLKDAYYHDYTEVVMNWFRSV